MLRYKSAKWVATDRNWRYIPFLVDHVQQYNCEFSVLELETREDNGLLSNVFCLSAPSQSAIDEIMDFLDDRTGLVWVTQITEDEYLRKKKDPRTFHRDSLSGSLFEHMKFQARLNRKVFHC